MWGLDGGNRKGIIGDKKGVAIKFICRWVGKADGLVDWYAGTAALQHLNCVVIGSMNRSGQDNCLRCARFSRLIRLVTT